MKDTEKTKVETKTILLTTTMEMKTSNEMLVFSSN